MGVTGAPSPLVLVAIAAIIIAIFEPSPPADAHLPRLPSPPPSWPSPQPYMAPPGRFVTLSHGKVHYTDTGAGEGPAAGETAVIVHGLMENVLLYRTIAKRLWEGGVRVITYDEYGVGWSDAPPGVKYDAHFFTGQLAELILALNLTGTPLHLIGHSMGGAIASSFAALYPQQVKSLALLAPAGIPFSLPLIAHIVKIPVLSDLLAPYIIPAIWDKRVKEAYPDPSRFIEAREEALAVARYHIAHNPAFAATLINCLRHFPFYDLLWAFEKIRDAPYPALLIWGDKDPTVPTANAHKLRALLPRSTLEIISDAGHVPHRQYPEIVAPMLFSFITNGKRP